LTNVFEDDSFRISVVKPQYKPGVRKARDVALLQQRQRSMWQCSDALARSLLESADVMSEGASRDEGERSVYYGTTSLLLLLASRGGRIPDDKVNEALRWLQADPHLRLRVVRLAQREAAQRANCELHCLHAEVTFFNVEGALRVDVEVEALQHSLSAKRRPA
jgi:hypothetical protein